MGKVIQQGFEKNKWLTGKETYEDGTMSWSISFPFAPAEQKLEPAKIIFNDGHTIVIWNDGTKTVSTTGSADVFDPEVGFALCVMKKLFGKKVYGRRLYRRMIAKAETQDEFSKEDLENWKRVMKENEKKEEKQADDFPF